VRALRAAALTLLTIAAPASNLEQLAAEGFHLRVRLGNPLPSQMLRPSGPCVLSNRHGQVTGRVSAGAVLRIDAAARGRPPAVWRVVVGEFQAASKTSARALAARVRAVVGRRAQTLEVDRQRGAHLLVTLGPFETHGQAESMREAVTRVFPGARVWHDSRHREAGRLRLRDAAGQDLGLFWEEVSLKPVDDDTVISARHGDSERTYRGRLICRATETDRILLVNDVHVEDFLMSVVAAEIGGDAPREALRAQAVAARSEALHKVEGSHFASIHYDLDDTPRTMVYPGVARETEASRRAVRATRGVVLMHGGEVCDAVFSHSCGGVTADSADVWLSPGVPYLRSRADMPRARPRPHLSSERAVRTLLANPPAVMCNPQGRRQFPSYARRHFRWSVRFSARNLAAQLGVNLGGVKSVRVAERGDSGRVIRLVIEGGAGTVELSKSTEIRRAIPDLESTLFVVDEGRDSDGTLREVRFVGGGWGHGVGMCQMGAYVRALESQRFDEILEAYFTDAELRRIY
jgi:SpoIID/LytB domain protein